MRKLPKIDLRKKRKFKNMVNRKSDYKYVDTPFVYFNNNNNNNNVEIINVEQNKGEKK